jgi:hypothetical protein
MLLAAIHLDLAQRNHGDGGAIVAGDAIGKVHSERRAMRLPKGLRSSVQLLLADQALISATADVRGT